MRNTLKKWLIAVNFQFLFILGFFSGPACDYSEAHYDINFQHSKEPYEGQLGIYAKEIPATLGGGNLLENIPVEIITIFDKELVEATILNSNSQNSILIPINKMLFEVDLDPNSRFKKDQIVLDFDPNYSSSIVLNRVRHIFEDGSVMIDEEINRASESSIETSQMVDFDSDIDSDWNEVPVSDDHKIEKYYSGKSLDFLYPEVENNDYFKGEKVLFVDPDCQESMEDCSLESHIYTYFGTFGDMILLTEEKNGSYRLVNWNANLIRKKD